MLLHSGRLLAVGLVTLAATGCGGSDRALTPAVMNESQHTHYHVHAPDVPHDHSHEDGSGTGGHEHSHQHSN